MQGCIADEIEELVEGFIQAFNNGDIATLDGIFAVGDSFRWYSTQPPGAPRDHADRTQLMAYFEARHDASERLVLRELTFGGNSDGFGNFEYRLTRRADDIPETEYEGKGAADCTTNDEAVIIVWAMAPA